MSDHEYFSKEEPLNSMKQTVKLQTKSSGYSEETIDNSNNHTSTILIVEDVESNYLLIKNILENDYRILHAWDGQEAIEIFQKDSPDLILMDIKMPNMNGWEATRIIRQHSTTIPIIAQTAFAYKADKQKAHDMGFNDFLTKPISVRLLRETIKRYLD